MPRSKKRHQKKGGDKPMRSEGGNKERKMRKARANPQWNEIDKSNEQFEKYYKAQNIVTSGEGWDKFMEFCRKDLPSTFRITGVRGHACDLLNYLKDGYLAKIEKEGWQLKEEVPRVKNEDGTTPDADKLTDKTSVDSTTNKTAADTTTTTGDAVSKPDNLTTAKVESEHDLLLEPIKWFPTEMAWNSNLSRRFIRRSDLLQKLHRFLVEDSECGAITRQEAVSMIPPLFLDVQSHHLVLDMCAAPGSKTAQIIEMMHSDATTGKFPTGCVFANDADHKRCYMLTHQSKRLNSPCVVITNHDASIYPKLYATDKETGTVEPVRFDRVLCDVPCSGDGTLRKNPLIWKKWTPHQGVALHRLQLRILARGMELTRVGGRLVYSTCSFNPVENEAVLATFLQRAQGSVELVDTSMDLPNLIRRPGLTDWKVYSRHGDIEYKSVEDISAKEYRGGYKETMFPPSKEVADEIHFDRCMRIYPQDQNTGGFFVAVLQKKSNLPWSRNKKELNSKCSGFLPWEDVPDIKKPKCARGEKDLEDDVDGPTNIGGAATAQAQANDEGDDVTQTNKEEGQQRYGRKAVRAGHKKGDFVADKEGDWNCDSCGNSNFQRRTECHRCKVPRADEVVMDDRKDDEDVIDTETTAVAGDADGVGAEGKGEKRKSENEPEAEEGAGLPPICKKFRRGMIKEDPYIFLDDTDVDLKALRDFYKIDHSLPSHQFMTRCSEGKKRHVYLVSEAVHNLMSNNMQSLKVINTGVRVITRSAFRAGKSEEAVGSEYRLVQDGINIIRDYVGDRTAKITKEDLIFLLSEGETLKDNLHHSTIMELSTKDMGCIVWHYEPDMTSNEPQHLTSTLFVCGHHGNRIVQCMLNKEERKHFLRLLRAPMPEQLEFKQKGSGWNDGKTKDEQTNGASQTDKDANGASQEADGVVADAEIKEE